MKKGRFSKLLLGLTPLALVATMGFGTLSASASTSTVSGTTLDFAESATVTPASAGSNVANLNSAINFQGGTIDVSTTLPTQNSTDYLRLDDNRGTAQGWNVLVSATNFTATVADKTSATAGATLDVSVPVASVMTFSGIAPTAINNSVMTGVSATTTQSQVQNTGTSLFTAQATAGAGAYAENVNYGLSFPNYFPSGTTFSNEQTDSAFNTATPTNVGLLAGDYSSTITYTINQTP